MFNVLPIIYLFMVAEIAEDIKADDISVNQNICSRRLF
jgi:hypothetical protein